MPLAVPVTTSGSMMCRLKDLRHKEKEDKWSFFLVYPFHQGIFPGTLVSGAEGRERWWDYVHLCLAKGILGRPSLLRLRMAPLPPLQALD